MTQDNCLLDYDAPRAAQIIADVCDHGTVTIHLKDKTGKTFAVAILATAEAVTLINSVCEMLQPFLEEDEDAPLPGESPIAS
jgi:hypothetical protein